MLRLSEHFLLLDFLYDQSTIDCVVQCGDLLADRIASINEDSEENTEGRYLCETVLEQIVERHGCISIGAGLWFKDLPRQGSAHHDIGGLGPHKWNRSSGAAADIVVHSWVDRDYDPTIFPNCLLGSDIEYHRALKYHGSEFRCLASRSTGNKYKAGHAEWDRLRPRPAGIRKPDWRRKPYSHSYGPRLRHDLGYDGRLLSAQALWAGTGEAARWCHPSETVVYGRSPPNGLPLLDHSIVEVPKDAFENHPVGGRKLCRPWHVRVSRNFVLLDLCRNERMFDRKMSTVPPLTFRTANTVIKVARMFGEVLDDVKEHLGNISVVRGMEPEGYSEDVDAREHRWIPAEGQIHSIEFVTPENPKPDYQKLIRKNVRKLDVRRDAQFGGDRVRVDIRDFTPVRCYTSAAGREYEWSA